MEASSRFDYVKFDDVSVENQKAFRSMVTELETHIDALTSPNARVKAIEYLEVCYMWIGKALRDDQQFRVQAAVAQLEGKADGQS